MLTTIGERCGIASYTRALIEGLRTLPETEVQVVPITEGRQPTAHYNEQAEILNAPDVDVVHVQHEHSFWGGILPKASSYWELRYLIKKPIVLTAHTTYSLAQMLRLDTERRPHKWLAKQLLVRNKAYRDSVEIAPFTTAMTIVHTRAAREELIARGAQSAYVHVVPAGIPAPAHAPTGGQSFREQHTLQGKRLATLFGYLAPNKGYELTLEVIPTLPEDVTVVIAGGPRNADMEPYAAQLRAAIERAGLTRRILITGFLSDTEVAEAMAASDFVLVPHTQATGSYSVTIPLSHGKVILASDLDCFKEIWERVDCLELFPAGNAAAYRDKLLALLDNPARQENLAANALKYAERFSWPRVAAATRKIYATTIQVFAEGHHPH
ncbi:MAG TPA: glycosyltransferase [Chthonomonadaceae bacterium]|nr:glycosyltransferase [Chthonomonadaceae bacterium]